jgi:hypothetical protein
LTFACAVAYLSGELTTRTGTRAASEQLSSSMKLRRICVPFGCRTKIIVAGS